MANTLAASCPVLPRIKFVIATLLPATLLVYRILLPIYLLIVSLRLQLIFKTQHTKERVKLNLKPASSYILFKNLGVSQGILTNSIRVWPSSVNASYTTSCKYCTVFITFSGLVTFDQLRGLFGSCNPLPAG